MLPLLGKAQHLTSRNFLGKKVLDKAFQNSTPCLSQQEPVYARIISKEINTNVGISTNGWRTLEGQIKLKIDDTLSINTQDTVKFECERNWQFTVIRTNANYLPNDSLLLNFEIQYSETNLPFYPVMFKVYVPFRHTSGKKTNVLASGRVYFTPYQVAELWSAEDFTELDRTWLVEGSNIDTTRIYIPRNQIPVSDLNFATDTIGGRSMEDIPTRSVFVKGLAYTIPMKYIGAVPTENQGDGEDSTYTETAERGKRLWRTFRGTISGRLVSRITNDVGRVVDIPLSGVMIKIKDRDAVGMSDVLTTGYSNANGDFFLSYISVQPFTEGRELELFLEIISKNESYDIRVKRNTHITAGVFHTEWEIGQAAQNVGVRQIGNVGINQHPFRALSWAVRSCDYVQNVGGQTLHKNLAIFPNSGTVSSFSALDSGNPQYPLIRMRAEDLQREFTIYHEMGHFVMWNVQGKNSIDRHGNPAFPNTPNRHFIGDLLPSDFAWVEGWANGFAFIMDGAHWWEDQEYAMNAEFRGQEFLAVQTVNVGIGNEWHLGCTLYDLWDGADKGLPLTIVENNGGVLTNRAIGWDDAGAWDDNVSFSFSSILAPLSSNSQLPLLQNVGEYFERFKNSQIAPSDCENKLRLANAFRGNRLSIDPTNINDAFTRSFSSDIIFITQNVVEQGLRNGNLVTFNNNFQVNPNPNNFFHTTRAIDILTTTAPSFINETLLVNGLANVPNSRVSLSGFLQLAYNGMIINSLITTCGNPQLRFFFSDFVLGRQLPITLEMSGTSLLEIGERATLSIRQGNKLVIKSGSTLYIHASATLEMGQDAELIVEQGGYICVEQGAMLNIDAQAKITIMAGANLGVNPVLRIETLGNCQHIGNEALEAYRLAYAELNNQNQTFNFGKNDFTMEFHVRLKPSSNLNRTLVSNRTDATQGYWVGINGAGKPFVEVNGTTISFVPLNPTFNALNIVDDACHQVAVKRQEGQFYFYVDGHWVGTGNQTSSTDFSGANPYLLEDRVNIAACAQQGCPLTFDGWMGEARFWSRAISDAEITQNYSNPITTLPTGLVAHYLFQEATGEQIIIDRTGNANGWLGANPQDTDHDAQRFTKLQVECDINGMFRPANPAIAPPSEEVQVFANPFEESFTVIVPTQADKDIKAEILTLQGTIIEKRVLQQGTNLWKPTLSLASGMYLLRLFGADKTIVLRLIKR
jgi:hypothetical protein